MGDTAEMAALVFKLLFPASCILSSNTGFEGGSFGGCGMNLQV